MYDIHQIPLEYANIIWDNCSIENKRNLESIKIEAAHIITGATKLCSIQKLYDDTGMQTLQKRRNNHKSFQLYKILNGLTPQYLQSLIPQRVQNIPILKSFKRQLNQTRNENPYPKYFDIVHTSRSGQIYHT